MNETIQKPLNMREAAEFLGVKPSYIYYLVHFGKLTAYKPGGKKLIFKLSELEKYAFSRSTGNMSERAVSILNTSQAKKPRRARA
jgi:excisionase family DNA binding protein